MLVVLGPGCAIRITGKLLKTLAPGPQPQGVRFHWSGKESGDP